MRCNGPTQPSFKLVILLISVVYPACIYLSLISMSNRFRLSILPEIQKCLRMTHARAELQATMHYSSFFAVKFIHMATVSEWVNFMYL